jgi:hypothetical protein
MLNKLKTLPSLGPSLVLLLAAMARQDRKERRR